MGWEMIPPECGLRFMVCMFVMLLLGSLAGWAIAHVWAKPVWQIRQEVLLEEKQERRERRRRRQERESC